MKAFDKLGWIIAAGVTGIMLGAGFQGAAPKFGTVDIEKVFNDSEFVKRQNESLRSMGTARQELIEFVDNNKSMLPTDVARLRVLMLKTPAAPTDKADIDKIRADAAAADRQFRELQTKSNPTEADRTALREFSQRVDANNRTLQQWGQEFQQELGQMQTRLRTESLTRAREAIKAVGKDQGFSVVFAEQIAPYSANDITESSLKQMNSRR